MAMTNVVDAAKSEQPCCMAGTTNCFGNITCVDRIELCVWHLQDYRKYNQEAAAWEQHGENKRALE